MATASSIETASGEEGDGDTLGWGIIIAAVAGPCTPLFLTAVRFRFLFPSGSLKAFL